MQYKAELEPWLGAPFFFGGGSEPWLRKLSEPWLKTPKNINFESCLKTHKNMSEPWLKPPKNITFGPLGYPDLAKQVLDKLALVSLLKSQNVWVMAQGIEKWEVKPWLKFNNWWVLSHALGPHLWTLFSIFRKLILYLKFVLHFETLYP